MPYGSSKSESENDNAQKKLSVRLGGLVLKEQSKLALKELLFGKDVLLCYRPASVNAMFAFVLDCLPTVKQTRKKNITFYMILMKQKDWLEKEGMFSVS